MKVNVLFFGATAEAAGTRDLELPIEMGARADAVFEAVLARFPRLKDHKLLFAVNRQYTNGEDPLADGDELAVFTAVSGG